MGVDRGSTAVPNENVFGSFGAAPTLNYKEFMRLAYNEAQRSQRDGPLSGFDGARSHPWALSIKGDLKIGLCANKCSEQDGCGTGIGSLTNGTLWKDLPEPAPDIINDEALCAREIIKSITEAIKTYQSLLSSTFLPQHGSWVRNEAARKHLIMASQSREKEELLAAIDEAQNEEVEKTTIAFVEKVLAEVSEAEGQQEGVSAKEIEDFDKQQVLPISSAAEFLALRIGWACGQGLSNDWMANLDLSAEVGSFSPMFGTKSISTACHIYLGQPSQDRAEPPNIVVMQRQTYYQSGCVNGKKQKKEVNGLKIVKAENGKNICQKWKVCLKTTIPTDASTFEANLAAPYPVNTTYLIMKSDYADPEQAFDAKTEPLPLRADVGKGISENDLDDCFTSLSSSLLQTRSQNAYSDGHNPSGGGSLNTRSQNTYSDGHDPSIYQSQN